MAENGCSILHGGGIFNFSGNAAYGHAAAHGVKPRFLLLLSGYKSPVVITAVMIAGPLSGNPRARFHQQGIRIRGRNFEPAGRPQTGRGKRTDVSSPHKIQRGRGQQTFREAASRQHLPGAKHGQTGRTHKSGAANGDKTQERENGHGHGMLLKKAERTQPPKASTVNQKQPSL